MSGTITPSGYTNVPVEAVRWGIPFEDLVADAIASLGARRVMVVASNTLRTRTDTISRLQGRLGDSIIEVFSDCQEHTPIESVVACADRARAANPDVFVTIGGSTPIDTVKIVQLALANNLRTVTVSRV